MKEVIRTNDLIKISLIKGIFDEAGIQYELLDTHTSIIEGSINAIEKRIIVSDNDFKQSENLIKELINNYKNE